MKQAVLKQQEMPVIAGVQEDLTLQTDEVLVEVKVVMICGSDLSYSQAETLSHDLQYLLVLGREITGIVREAGTAVSDVQRGDRVTVEPQSYCGHCEACQRGDHNFCEPLQFMVSEGISGALKQYVKWPQGSIYKLEGSMSFKGGALPEPLSVAHSVIEKLNFHKESRFVILEAGSIGPPMGMLMQELYPEVSVHLVDVYESRRDIRERLHVKKDQFLIETAYELEFMKPSAHIIDTVGSSEVVKQLLQYSIPQVAPLEFGVGGRPLEISLRGTVHQGLHIIGSHRYTNTYLGLLKLFREQYLQVHSIVTGRYPSETVQTAFEQAMDGRHHSRITIYL